MDQASISPAYADSLTSKHAALQAKIDAEEHRPHPDETILAELKKAKLKVKDVILGH